MDNDGKNSQETQLEEIQQKCKALGFESIDDVLRSRDDLADEVQKLKTQWEETQQFVRRQSNEIGELRKKVKGGLTEQTTETKVVPEAKATPDNEPTLDELEAALTEDQRRAADAVYESLPDYEPNETGLSKAMIASSADARRALLKQAQLAVKSVPKSLWEKPKAPSNATAIDDMEQRIKRLFHTEHGQSRFVPEGPSRGASSLTASDTPQTISHVGTKGVLAHIDATRRPGTS